MSERRSPQAGPTLLAIGLLLLLGMPAAGSPSVTDYTLTSWTQYEGLPAARVWAITQDRDGYIWIGTDAGLVRFDGVDFLVWRDLGEVPLPRREVTALYSARDGSLWAGFGVPGGIARIHGGDVVLYGEAEGIVSGFVTFITEDQRGTIWAGGRGGLHGFDGSRWTHLGAQSGIPEGPSLELYRDVDGNLWIGHASGLFRQVGRDTFRADPAPAVFGSTLTRAVLDASASTWRSAQYRFSLLQDRRGGVWVATAGRGLWIGNAAAGTDVPVVDNMTAQDGLSSDVVLALFEDREGHVWVGTQSGLHQFSPHRVTQVTVPGLVRAVEATPDGGVWAGTYDGVVKLSETAKQPFPRVDGLFGTVTALHGDADGRCVGGHPGQHRHVCRRSLRSPPATRDHGVFMGVGVDHRPPRRPVDPATCTAGYSAGGMAGWTGSKRCPPRIATPSTPSIPMRPATSGSASPTASWGVIHADHTFRLYDSIPGLGGVVNVLYQDRGGALWVGASDGLSRFEDDRFTTATQRGSGMPVDWVSAVVEDGEGNLWVGTRSGILSFRPDEFDKLQSDPGHQVEYRLYDRFDGVLSVAVRLGNPVGTRGADGRLWFVTGSSAVVIDPGQLPDEPPPPPVRIEAVHVDGRPVGAASPLRLPSGSSRLRISYTALTYAAPTRTQFRYRLEGFDPDWIGPETRREAFYAGLPAGDYRFRVMAKNNRGCLEP